MRCDVCNAIVSNGSEKLFTPDVFNCLMDFGFGLDETNIKMLTDGGMSRQAAEAKLKEQYSHSSSDWLLCPDCTKKAESIIESNETKVPPDYITVTQAAKDVGFGFDMINLPVAISFAVWQEYVVWTDEDSECQTYQEQDARLEDILFMGGQTLQSKMNQFYIKQIHKYSLLCVPKDCHSTEGLPVNLLIRILKVADQQWLVIEIDKEALNASPTCAPAGLDPELAILGAKMAGYHMERGIRKFAEFARKMQSEMGDNWQKLRPYLFGFWQHSAIDFPDAQDLNRKEAQAILDNLDYIKYRQYIDSNGWKGNEFHSYALVSCNSIAILYSSAEKQKEE